MRTAGWTDSVTVLDRLTAVLEAFDDEEELGISELARRANLPKSTVSRIAAELSRQGCLDHIDGKLGLGAKLFELGNAVEVPRALREAALPVMAGLRAATGQTVYAALVDGTDVVIVCIVRGRSSLPRGAALGSRHEAAATPFGRAILACASAKDAGHVADGGAWVTSLIPWAGSDVIAVLALDAIEAQIGADKLALDTWAAAVAIGRRLASLQSST